jgi:CcmD family protein
MKTMGYIIAAYTIVFGTIAGYVLLHKVRRAKIEKEVAFLKQLDD